MQTFNSNAILAEYKLRRTLARVRILDLFQAGQTYTSEQVYRVLAQRGDDLSLATTYRVLAQFFDVGVLHRQQLDGGPARYFMPQATPSEHLLCTACGGLMPLPGGDIAKVLRQLAAKHGYLLAEYELLLQGTCPGCAKKREIHGAKSSALRPSQCDAMR